LPSAAGIAAWVRQERYRIKNLFPVQDIPARSHGFAQEIYAGFRVINFGIDLGMNSNPSTRPDHALKLPFKISLQKLLLPGELHFLAHNMNRKAGFGIIQIAALINTGSDFSRLINP
jgi:hypothetical protein